MRTETATRTQRTSLELEMEPGRNAEMALRGVRPGDVGRHLSTVGQVVAMARVTGAGHELIWADPSTELARFEPRLSSTRFESPLLVVVPIPEVVITSVAATSFLFYALKKIGNADLEFRADRERLRADLRRAAADAEEAELELESVRRMAAEAKRRIQMRGRHEGLGREEILRILETEMERIEALRAKLVSDRDWDPGAVQYLDRISSEEWQGHGTVREEDG